MLEFAKQFGTSAARAAILKGLIAYRSGLRGLGITSGRQLLSGSFLEDIETLESRPPNDVDVISLIYWPKSQIEKQQVLSQNLGLFHRDLVKSNFKCDVFLFDLYDSTLNPPTNLFYYNRLTGFWLTFFSHRRNGDWKGIAQVDMSDPSDDVAAETYLEEAFNDGH